MRTDLECVLCMTRHAVDAVRLLTPDEAAHEEVLRRVLGEMAGTSLDVPPPAIARQIHHTIRQVLRDEDPYREIKAHGNALASRLAGELRARVAGSPDPLETAVRLAIAGNIIDYGTRKDVADSAVEETIARALSAPLDRGVLEALRAAVRDAGRILYLGDNAGEICFDRLLVEQLPREKLTFAVRGGPIINDVTREDARAAGITDLVPVIDTGCAAPGILMAECNPEFRRAFAEADVVLVKGQGNYETLDRSDPRLFFLFMVKCRIVAGHLGCELGSVQLRRGS